MRSLKKFGTTHTQTDRRVYRVASQLKKQSVQILKTTRYESGSDPVLNSPCTEATKTEFPGTFLLKIIQIFPKTQRGSSDHTASKSI